MVDAGWRLQPFDDQTLVGRVLSVHQELLRVCFATDPMLNRLLPVEARALRRIEDWRALLVLTPWMFSRLWFPDRVPSIPVHTDWHAEARSRGDYRVLGPRVELELWGRKQPAHLNCDTDLGHYLLQPICLNMTGYASAEAVYRAWNDVIGIRDANMERAQRECPMQKEVSRREFFGRFKPE